MTYDARLVFFCFAFLINTQSVRAQVGTLEKVIEAAETGRDPDYIKPLMQLHLTPKLDEFVRAKRVQTATQKLAWWLTMRSTLEVINHSASRIHKDVAVAKWSTGACSTLESAVLATFDPIWSATKSEHCRSEGDAIRKAAYDIVSRAIGFDKSTRASSAYEEAYQFTLNAYKEWELQWDPDSIKRKSEINVVYDISNFVHLTRHSRTMNCVANRIAEWRLLNWLIANIDYFLGEAYNIALQALAEHRDHLNKNPFESNNWLSEFLQESKKHSGRHDIMVFLAPWLAPILPVDDFFWSKASALLASRTEGPLTVWSFLPSRIFDPILSGLLQVHRPEQFQYGLVHTEPPSRSAKQYMARIPVYEAFLDECYKK